MLAPSDRIISTDPYEENEQDNELTHFHSGRKHLPREIDIRMDL